MFAVGAIPYDTKDKVRRRILKAAALGADLVEFRLDYWNGPMPDFSEEVELARRYGMNVIITVRDPREGGIREVEWKEEAFKLAKELGCWCDVEARLYSEPPCEKNIASIHFFNEPTENDYRLVEKLSLSRNNFAIFKVAAKVSTIDELLKLARSTRHPRKAFMPMGKGSEKLRLITPFLGSHLSYGSIEEGTAPGQVPLELIVKAVMLSRVADELYSPGRVK